MNKVRCVANWFNEDELQRMLTYMKNVGELSAEGSTNGVAQGLQYWIQAKSQFLFDLFQDELIYEKEISYEPCEEDITEWFHNILGSESITTLYKTIQATEMKDAFRVYQLIFERDHILGNQVMIHPDRWVARCLKTSPWGKRMVQAMCNGIKPMKALRKLIAYISTPENAEELKSLYEDIRIQISNLLAAKSCTGTLCVSLHPMDYWTMSNNPYDWDSCMEWGGGSYAAGTIEMTNSTCCLVAYIKGNRNFTFGKEQWNGKKWRTLVLAKPDGVIVCPKNYPDYRPDVEKQVLEMLQELYIQMGIDTVPIGEIARTKNSRKDENHPYIWNIETDYMYNDFDANSDLTVQGFYPKQIMPKAMLEFQMSGKAMCPACGQDWIEDQAEIFCPACADDPRIKCGEHSCDASWRLSDLQNGDIDPVYHLDGEWYCEDCIDEVADYDDWDHEYYIKGELDFVTMVVAEKRHSAVTFRMTYRNFTKNFDPALFTLTSCEGEKYFILRDLSLMMDDNGTVTDENLIELWGTSHPGPGIEYHTADLKHYDNVCD